MSGQANFLQTDSPIAPAGAGKTVLSFPATATNQLKWVDFDGGTNIIAGGGFTLTVPATGTAALTGLTLAQFAATTSAQLAGIISDETGSGALVFGTSPTFLGNVILESANARLLVGGTTTAAATAGLDIINANGIGLIMTNVITDTTTKASSFGVRHYTNSEEALLLIRGSAQNTINALTIGGGSSLWNTATQIDFYTAATTTTVTGTSRMTIKTDGKIGFATQTPTYDFGWDGNAMRTWGMERHTTANTAGNDLTMQAGGATASATDKAGGDLILLPGASTGTGRANVRLRNYSRATASGTADNTAVDRLIIAGAVALTDAATSMFEIALAAGASAGGCILWTIRASDGTDHQAFSGVTTFSAVNKAGVYTTTVTTNANNDAKAVSAGTLTVTFSLLNGANKVTAQVTPAGSLTESSYYQMSYTLFNNSPQSITVL